ncbi:MAG: Stage II sporulation E family protein [uncultured bacterium]|nr:MAG: Stage II sporulation E family protein [uncultured bacterium]
MFVDKLSAPGTPIRVIIFSLLFLIFVIVSSFLFLSISSFQAFTQFLDVDQKSEIVLGRFYEQLMDKWFELSQYRVEAYFHSRAIDAALENSLLQELAEISKTLNHAVETHPRKEKWLAIKDLLSKYLSLLATFNSRMKEWQILIQKRASDNIQEPVFMSEKIASVSFFLGKVKENFKNHSFIASESPDYKTGIQELEEIGNAIASLKNAMAVSESGKLNLLTFSNLETRIDTRYGLFYNLVSSGSENLSESNRVVFNETKQTLHSLEEAFEIVLKGLKKRKYSELILEEAIHSMDREMRQIRNSGIDLCLNESNLLWQNIEKNTEALKSQIYEKFILRFLFLGFSLIIVLAALVFVPKTLSVPLENLRIRFLTVKPGESIKPAEIGPIREVNELEISFQTLVKKVADYVKLQTGYIQATTNLWSVLSILFSEPQKSEVFSLGFSKSAAQLLMSLGKQIPQISFAEVFCLQDENLVLLCPAFAAEEFENTAKFIQYSSGLNPLRLNESLCGWAYNQASISPIGTDPGEAGPLFFQPVSTRVIPISSELKKGLDGSFLAVKLNWRGQLVAGGLAPGLLFLYFDTLSGDLMPADFLFISSVAHQLTTISKMAELLGVQEKEREHSYQLSMAREIQQRMLPGKPPSIPGLGVNHIFQMANSVGGDFVEFFLLQDGGLGVVIADVCGKNLPAALYTMVLKAALQSSVVEPFSPVKIITQVNRVLFKMMQEGSFVTMLVGKIDPIGKLLTWSNGGHVPIYLCRKTTTSSFHVETLVDPAFPLGICEEQFYERNYALNSDDLLLFLTDGVIECVNDKKERFGEGRLKDALMRFRPNPIVGIMREIENFRDGVPYSDDIAMISVDLFSPIPNGLKI